MKKHSPRMPRAPAVLGVFNMNDVAKQAQEIVAQIKRLSSPRFKKQMSERFGINTEFAVGTPVTQLRELAKKIPHPNQQLAETLWQTNVHEARILASILSDPARISATTLKTWVHDLNSWDICDACAGNLFCKLKNPLPLIERWMKNEEEFVRRAGFATLACLAMPRAKTPDNALLPFMPLIKIHAADPRPMVHKAVNWALRNIGKKNPRLTPFALACVDDILDLYEDNKAARWVAHNARWELNSPKIKALISTRR